MTVLRGEKPCRTRHRLSPGFWHSGVQFRVLSSAVSRLPLERVAVARGVMLGPFHGGRWIPCSLAWVTWHIRSRGPCLCVRCGFSFAHGRVGRSMRGSFIELNKKMVTTAEPFSLGNLTSVSPRQAWCDIVFSCVELKKGLHEHRVPCCALLIITSFTLDTQRFSRRFVSGNFS